MGSPCKSSVVTAMAMIAIVASTTEAEGETPRHEMKAVPVGNPATWFGPDDYPVEAIQSEREGRVVVTVGVDSGGRTVSCHVDVSSGTTLLDERTCELAMSRGVFDPATDASGVPIASTYLLPVRWTMPDAEARARAAATPIELNTRSYERVREMETTIDAKGYVVSCRALSPLDETGDPCRSTVPGSLTSAIFLKNGAPVGVVYRQRLSISVRPADSASDGVVR